MKKIERLGLEFVNKWNEKYKVIDYINTDNVIIQFENGFVKKVKWREVIKCKITNPFTKRICGVGYIGEGEYHAKENNKITKKYNSWNNMINRCYNPYVLNERPTYIDCYVEDDLHNFQNFAKWYDENYYECNNEKMHLDKDILYKENKIYSKDTMIFVPERINALFTKVDAKRGDLPIGVTYNKKNNNLRAICSVLDENGKTKLKHLGCFPLNKPFQAFTCYKQFKENYIKQIADEYYSKDLIPKKLYDALYRYEVEIND